MVFKVKSDTYHLCVDRWGQKLNCFLPQASDAFQDIPQLQPFGCIPEVVTDWRYEKEEGLCVLIPSFCKIIRQPVNTYILHNPSEFCWNN